MGDQMEAIWTLHPLVCTPGPHRTSNPRYGRLSCFAPTTAFMGLKGLGHFGVPKSIFSKYLKTVGESKERHGGPNGSPWDPPSPGMHPGTPPHTQPEIWPIFRFWAHEGLHGPQGTGPFWGPKFDFPQISQNWWGIEGKAWGTKWKLFGPSIPWYALQDPTAHPTRDMADCHVLDPQKRPLWASRDLAS